MCDLLIFTDLDGTLLDHHSYSFAPARPALERLAAAGIPLVLNSSKTAAEIRQLRRELDNPHPFIVENGSAVCIPSGYFTEDAPPGSKGGAALEVQTFGPSYADLLSRLHPLRRNAGYHFRGFADLSTAELAALTGLTPEHAALAQQRQASEPLLWEDSATALAHFQADLQEMNLTLVRGGRFLHVMGPVDKAAALTWLANRYRAAWPDRAWQTVALGDSPNDRAMLEAADLAVTIPPASGAPLQLNRTERVIRPAQHGPHGWQEAMTQILNAKRPEGA